jgi:hypothetical protein
MEEKDQYKIAREILSYAVLALMFLVVWAVLSVVKHLIGLPFSLISALIIGIGLLLASRTKS